MWLVYMLFCMHIYCIFILLSFTLTVATSPKGQLYDCFGSHRCIFIRDSWVPALFSLIYRVLGEYPIQNKYQKPSHMIGSIGPSSFRLRNLSKLRMITSPFCKFPCISLFLLRLDTRILAFCIFVARPYKPCEYTPHPGRNSIPPAKTYLGYSGSFAPTSPPRPTCATTRELYIRASARKSNEPSVCKALRGMFSRRAAVCPLPHTAAGRCSSEERCDSGGWKCCGCSPVSTLVSRGFCWSDRMCGLPVGCAGL